MVEYVGLDVSKEETAFCAKDASGHVLSRGKVSTDPDALFRVLQAHCLCPERIVLETGTLSGWSTGGLRQRGLRVECVDTRRAHAALTYCATIDDPARFVGSPAVGVYLGLTSRRWQSGAVGYGGRTSKMGDGLLRHLL